MNQANNYIQEQEENLIGDSPLVDLGGHVKNKFSFFEPAGEGQQENTICLEHRGQEQIEILNDSNWENDASLIQHHEQLLDQTTSQMIPDISQDMNPLNQSQSIMYDCRDSQIVQREVQEDSDQNLTITKSVSITSAIKKITEPHNREKSIQSSISERYLNQNQVHQESAYFNSNEPQMVNVETDQTVLQSGQDEEDQPSLRSPGPQMIQVYHEDVGQIQIDQANSCRVSQTIQKGSARTSIHESSADRYKVSHVIKGLKHQQSCRPAPQHQKTQSAVGPKNGCSHVSITALNGNTLSNYKSKVSETKQLSDSPELQLKHKPIRTFEDGLNKDNAWDIPQLFSSSQAENDLVTTNEDIESKEMPQSIHENTAQNDCNEKEDIKAEWQQRMGQGLLDKLPEKTPIKTDFNVQDYQMVDHQEQLQGQNEFQKSIQLSLSPYLKGPQPHFESSALKNTQLTPVNGVQKSGFKNRETPQTPQHPLFNFDVRKSASMNPFTSSRANPLGQSMNLQFGFTPLTSNPQQRQSMVSESMHKLLTTSFANNSATGHQYEVLLKERQDLQATVSDLQNTNDEAKKQLNQLKSQQAKLKFELTESREDLDETEQKLRDKDAKLKESKEMVAKQGAMIEELRKNLFASEGRERQANTQNDQNRRKMMELEKLLEDLQEEQDKVQKTLLPQLEGNQRSQDRPSEGEGGTSSKTKEIYALTVELGCIREENQELKTELETQKQDYSERMEDQRARSIEEYTALFNELETLKIEHSAAQIEHQSQTESLKQQLQQTQEEMDKKLNDLKQDLQSRDDEVLASKRECDTYKEQINQFSNNYQILNDHLKEVQDKIERDRLAAENTSKITVTTLPQLASVAQVQSVDSATNDKKDGLKPEASNQASSLEISQGACQQQETLETKGVGYFDEISEIKKGKQEGNDSQIFLENQPFNGQESGVQSPQNQATLVDESNPSLRFSNSDQDTEMRRLKTGRSGKSSDKRSSTNEYYQDEAITEKCIIDSSKLYGGRTDDRNRKDFLGSQTSRPSSKRTCTTSNHQIGKKDEVQYIAQQQRPASSQVMDQLMVRSNSEFGLGMQNNLSISMRRKTVQTQNRMLNQSVRQAQNPNGSMVLNISKAALGIETDNLKNPAAKRGTNLYCTGAQKSPIARAISGPLGIGSRLVASRRKQSSIFPGTLDNSGNKGPMTNQHNFKPKEGNATARGKIKSTSYSSVQGGFMKTKGSLSGQKTAGTSQVLNTSNLEEREMANKQLVSSNKFSQPCHTARQHLRKSPRPSVQGATRVPFNAVNEQNQAQRASRAQRKQFAQQKVSDSCGANTTRLYQRPEWTNGTKNKTPERPETCEDSPIKEIPQNLIQSKGPTPGFTTARNSHANSGHKKSMGSAEFVCSPDVKTARVEPRTELVEPNAMPLVAQENAWKENLRGSIAHKPNLAGPGGLSLSYKPDSGLYQMDQSAPSTPNQGSRTQRTGVSYLKGSPGKPTRGSDMQSKLQSIQTGKAYLEKKIQEYESRLSQMKQKKDRQEKCRGTNFSNAIPAQKQYFER